MNKLLIIKNNRCLNFTSKYNVKLYKKCLSFKLFFDKKKNLKYNQPNLFLINKNSLSSSFLFKRIYARREYIPLRLLSFFVILNSVVKLTDMSFMISPKLSVYSGKLLKLIGSSFGDLVAIRCGYRFGDLIFTRARYVFRKKKKKKK